jgi:hypothetical protein
MTTPKARSRYNRWYARHRAEQQAIKKRRQRAAYRAKVLGSVKAEG